MNKEQKSKEYAELKVKQYDKNHTIEKYGMHRAMQQCNFDGFDIQEAFEEGWDEALKNQWIKVKDKLPDVDISVLVLTSNKKVSISKRYQPKDCKGNDVGLVYWSGSYAFVNSIVAWMPIPPFDEIFKQLKIDNYDSRRIHKIKKA